VWRLAARGVAPGGVRDFFRPTAHLAAPGGYGYGWKIVMLVMLGLKD